MGSSGGVGQRIRAVRKARGIKSTADLAALIPDGLISGAVLRNIEVGVKPDLSVSQLLNIARALNVSPIFLLVPVREPDAPLDLPNLSADFAQMKSIDFIEWLSGTSDAIRDWTTPEDHGERNQLRAMREIERLVTERTRLMQISELTLDESVDEPPATRDDIDAYAARATESERQIVRLSGYLKSAGWNVRRWTAKDSAD